MFREVYFSFARGDNRFVHDLASVNFLTLAASDVRIPALSVAALYGKGVFTTVAIHDGTPFLWEKHWRRLKENSERLGIDLSDFPETNTRKALDELIRANLVRDGRGRVTFFDESTGGLWAKDESASKTSLLITTADPRSQAENFRLGVSPFTINSASPLAGVKSSNYLEKIASLATARDGGFDEAIQLNERGEIAAACMANVFWLKDGTLFTPDLATGCLAGTTREFVMENTVVSEVRSGIDSLHDADEIFLTSAGLGIVQVSEFEGRVLKGQPHSITELLQRE